MKITKVEPLLCDSAWGVWVFIKIQTDEGITGYGECSDHRGFTFGLVGCIKDLELALVGQDPRQVEKLYSDMYRLARQALGGVALKAIAGIDIALWDIKAKALGVPLYELFGGPYRNSIRLYWGHCGLYRARIPDLMQIPPLKTTEDIFNLGKEVVSRGYTALKTNATILTGDPTRISRLIVREKVESAQRIIETFREAVGDKVDICLDLSDSFNNDGFISISKAIEPYNLMWLEVDTNNPEALLHMKQSARTPICSGGILCTTRAYKPFLDLRSMDYAMVEVAGCGFTESKRIASLADTNEMLITPYNANSHLSTFITAHLCASVPNVKIMGIDVDGAPWKDDIVTEIPDIKDGYINIPAKPGLGVELNEKEIAKHPWLGHRG
jgi:L-alanine-DL-glutamate epimerase-like enolase superfamily enzyme